MEDSIVFGATVLSQFSSYFDPIRSCIKALHSVLFVKDEPLESKQPDIGRDRDELCDGLCEVIDGTLHDLKCQEHCSNTESSPDSSTRLLSQSKSKAAKHVAGSKVKQPGLPVTDQGNKNNTDTDATTLAEDDAQADGDRSFRTCSPSNSLCSLSPSSPSLSPTTPYEELELAARQNGWLASSAKSDACLLDHRSRCPRTPAFLFLRYAIRDGVDNFWERLQKPYITDKATSHLDQQSVLTGIEQLLTLNGWMARRIGTQNIFVSMLDYDLLDSTETLLDLCEAVLTLLGVPFSIHKVPPVTEDPAAAYYSLKEAHTRNLVLEPLYEFYQRRKVKFHRVIWLKGFTCRNEIFEAIMVSQANNVAMVCGMDWAEHNGFFIFSDRWRTRDINGNQFRQFKLSSAASAGPPHDPAGAAHYAQHLPFQVFCCESGTHVVDHAQTFYTGLRYRAGAQVTNLSTTDAGPCFGSSQAHFCRDLWLSAARGGVCAVEERAGAASKAAAGGGGLGLRFNLGWGAAKPMEAAVAAGEDTRWRHVKRAEEAAEEAEEGEEANCAEEDEQANRAEEDKQVNRAEEGEQAKHVEEGERGRHVDEGHAQRQRPPGDSYANVGSDFDAMPDTGEGETDDAAAGEDDELADAFSIPNSVFRAARILVNPRCVTTYAGVSHAQLVLDLFGPDKDEEDRPGSHEK
ncbi:cryptococcal mannosyltransferase 1-domain-containing protein [Phellopilus nigrolimitatus]|nr:cryptococcal mannosyltransferase 1-domain-containing protein [Phellopilus nigrolimitatus]